MPLRGLSLSIEVLLKMTNRMNKKTTTSLPRLIRGRMSMNLAKYTPLYDVCAIMGTDGYIHEAMMPIHCSLSVTLLMQTVILN